MIPSSLANWGNSKWIHQHLFSGPGYDCFDKFATHCLTFACRLQAVRKYVHHSHDKVWSQWPGLHQLRWLHSVLHHITGTVWEEVNDYSWMERREKSLPQSHFTPFSIIFSPFSFPARCRLLALLVLFYSLLIPS